MTAGGTDTTAQDESSQHGPKPELTLQWVWPRLRREHLRGARLSIGRDEAANIRLDGAGVSRQHAELYRQGPLYVIRDLASTNGTWLGGRLEEHAPITPGGVLRIGEWVGVFVERSEEASEFAELSPGLFGGPELAMLLATVERAAKSNVPVLIVGETGTGKELFARAVHDASARTGAFLPINCASLPEQLAEAELFGYRRGAFTSAERNNPGHFRAANGGTLFLDELPELSLGAQAKLLRVVERGEVLSLGGSERERVDVRLVSASQRPLDELVSIRRLREDLAIRLTGLELRLPALRQRRADIVPLFAALLKQHAGGRPPEVDARVIEALCLYDWPQNVRSLELVARTLLAVHGHEPRIKLQHLPAAIAERRATSAPAESERKPLRGRREHDLARLEAELKQNGGNVKAAAAALGISRQRVYRLLEDRNAEHSGANGST